MREEVRRQQHDRFLVTNRNIVLNFTQGFNLIRDDHTLGENFITLYQEKHGDLDWVNEHEVGFAGIQPPRS